MRHRPYTLLAVLGGVVALVAALVAALAPGAQADTRAVPTRTPTSRTVAARPASVGSTPPAWQREQATNAFYQSILTKVKNGQSLYEGNFENSTAQQDVLDYGVDALWSKGIDGAGTTVAILLSSPDPQLPSVLANYDQALGLPAAQLTMMQWPQTNPPTTSCTFEQACGPGEDRLDAESIHRMAPFAKLLFVYTPMPETLGVQGWSQLAQATEHVADNHLADVITVSESDGELDFLNDPSNPGASQAAAIHSLDPALLDVAAHNVPIMFASGDCGSTQVTLLNEQTQCAPAVGETAGHPVDSPWVTSVGGTIVNSGVGTTGGRTGPDTLWTADQPDGPYDAAGAGISTVYSQPSWQRGVAALRGVTGRSEPDISMDADDGTSQASPTFAGIMALATQYHRGLLGNINQALYRIGPEGSRAGIVDVPAGDTDAIEGVPGYQTGPGFDTASGWGTIYAPAFVPALSRAINGAPAREARAELARLQNDVWVNRPVLRSGSTVTVTGRGYVPGRTPNGSTIKIGFGFYPTYSNDPLYTAGQPVLDPNSTVPGQPWDTVTATLTDGWGRPVTASIQLTPPDSDGRVTACVVTSVFAPGRYRLTLQGDLLRQSVSLLVLRG
ncbi:MAG: S8 family serine peptidase [Actinobacteria bacterium]|nr:S8 family serine peptidase [Actinomycetota bacterium]